MPTDRENDDGTRPIRTRHKTGDGFSFVCLLVNACECCRGGEVRAYGDWLARRRVWSRRAHQRHYLEMTPIWQDQQEDRCRVNHWNKVLGTATRVGCCLRGLLADAATSVACCCSRPSPAVAGRLQFWRVLPHLLSCYMLSGFVCSTLNILLQDGRRRVKHTTVMWSVYAYLTPLG